MTSPPEFDHWIALARRGEMGWSELAERLLQLEHPAVELDRPDIDRRRRCGFGEVIYGRGKSPETIRTIAARLLASGQRQVLVTRCQAEWAGAVSTGFPFSRFDCLGLTLRLGNHPIAPVNVTSEDQPTSQPVLVVTAGSTDLPVAREALETLRWMGNDASLLTDVGVAGPYRLLPHLARLRAAPAVVVCAGMEGALASVLGGLIPCPIIAVPTSVGYGTNLAGVTTLLSMLSSCAAGVTVVNIDAGFKGGYVAGLIAAGCPSPSPAAHCE